MNIKAFWTVILKQKLASGKTSRTHRRNKQINVLVTKIKAIYQLNCEAIEAGECLVTRSIVESDKC